MTWLFTRPGRVKFEKGEPFCFISLVEHRKVEAAWARLEPKLKALAKGHETDVDGAFRSARNGRTTLMAGFTTVADLGGSNDAVFAVLARVARGVADQAAASPTCRYAGSNPASFCSACRWTFRWGLQGWAAPIWRALWAT